MSTLLVHVTGNRLLNKSIFRPHLYVYDNRIVYKRRHLLTHDELTVTYNHISQVDLYRYIIRFAHIEIITTGQQKIKVPWTSKRKAIKVKSIIDEKVFQSHKRGEDSTIRKNLAVQDFELSLKRLNELLNTGRITEREFKRKKKELLKKHY